MVDSNEQGNSSDAGNRPSPGARLRAARERKGLTLVEAADALRLDHALLEALERDDFAALGAPVFAKGHLRKYAALTGERIDDVLLEYHQRAGLQQAPPLVDQSRSVLRVSTPRSVPTGAIVVALLLAGALAAVWWWYKQPVERPTPIGGANAGLTLPDDGSENADYATSPPLPSGDAGTGEESDAAPEPSLDDPPAPAPSAGPDTSQQTTPGASTRGEPLAATTPAAPSSALALEAPRSAPAIAPAQGSEHQLVLTFGGDSWVEVRDAAGARLYYGLGVTGSRRTVRGVPPFEVFLGRYLDVGLELDGRALAIPADSVRGNTARFTLSPT